MSAAGVGRLSRGLKGGSAQAEKVAGQSSTSSHVAGKASEISKGGTTLVKADLQEVMAEGDTTLGAAPEVGKGGGSDKGEAGLLVRNKNTRNRERGAPLQFFAQVQGADRVVIPAEEWDCATGKFRNALVGFVFGSKPFLGRMKGFAMAKWGNESVVKVSQLNEGIFLINFTKEDKKMDVLLGGPWTFDNRPLILKEWSEQEDYSLLYTQL